jgi:hypothetical protein
MSYFANSEGFEVSESNFVALVFKFETAAEQPDTVRDPPSHIENEGGPNVFDKGSFFRLNFNIKRNFIQLGPSFSERSMMPSQSPGSIHGG